METHMRKQKVEYDMIGFNSNNSGKDNSNDKLSIREITIDYEKAKSQKILNIAGVEIIFPYEPYTCQLEYMKKSINYK